MRPSEDVMVAELAGLVRAGMPVRRLIPALLPMREPGAPGLPKCSRLPRLRAQPHILWSRALAIVSGMRSVCMTASRDDHGRSGVIPGRRRCSGWS